MVKTMKPDASLHGTKMLRFLTTLKFTQNCKTRCSGWRAMRKKARYRLPAGKTNSNSFASAGIAQGKNDNGYSPAQWNQRILFFFEGIESRVVEFAPMRLTPKSGAP